MNKDFVILKYYIMKSKFEIKIEILRAEKAKKEVEKNVKNETLSPAIGVDSIQRIELFISALKWVLDE